MVRRQSPLPLYLGAGDRSVSDRPAGSYIEFSSPAPSFFSEMFPRKSAALLAVDALSVRFGPRT